MMKRLMVTTAVAAAAVPIALVGGAPPAVACGGLVGENGTIELVKTTTLAAYNDGVERYMTAFQFSGEGEELGTIIPLPDVPTEVVKGGNWTLQRLVQEITPPPAGDQSGDAEAGAATAEVEVILETEVDALDITVVRGGGDEVGEWATDNGFFLTPDAPEVLDFYAERSPVFMAAKFNVARAAELGQEAGQATPVMATIPTDTPWVPLRILGLGLEEDQTVEADVFLLTESDPQLLAGGPGIEEQRSEAASDLLLDDLRSDERMEWVPEDMWLSYLQVDTPAAELDYDLAVSVDPDAPPSLTDAGVERFDAVPVDAGADGVPLWPLAVGAAMGLGLLLVVGRGTPVRQGPVAP
jgi:hypothetical protein